MLRFSEENLIVRCFSVCYPFRHAQFTKDQDRAMLNPFRSYALALLLCLAVEGKAHQGATQTAPAIVVGKVYEPFIGAWTGELEYRDFQSEQKVKLPTWLVVQLSPDGRGMQFHYTYDDGPTKVIEELAAVTVDTQNATFTVTSDRDKSKDMYQIAGLEKFASAGRGTLELTGTGTENDQKVDVRISIKVGRNFYRYEKETKIAGGGFQFRDSYNFTRRDPPIIGP
jgi:hypothetical protein